VRVIEETSAYWRVLFENPPFNIVDATIFEGLHNQASDDVTAKAQRWIDITKSYILIHRNQSNDSSSLCLDM
jgi:hypothetical protein